MGAWLRAIGLERYEEGLVHNGWDDLEFLRWGQGWKWMGWGWAWGAKLGALWTAWPFSQHLLPLQRHH